MRIPLTGKQALVVFPLMILLVVAVERGIVDSRWFSILIPIVGIGLFIFSGWKFYRTIYPQILAQISTQKNALLPPAQQAQPDPLEIRRSATPLPPPAPAPAPAPAPTRPQRPTLTPVAMAPATPAPLLPAQARKASASLGKSLLVAGGAFIAYATLVTIGGIVVAAAVGEFSVTGGAALAIALLLFSIPLAIMIGIALVILGIAKRWRASSGK